MCVYVCTHTERLKELAHVIVEAVKQALKLQGRLASWSPREELMLRFDSKGRLLTEVPLQGQCFSIKTFD